MNDECERCGAPVITWTPAGDVLRHASAELVAGNPRPLLWAGAAALLAQAIGGAPAVRTSLAATVTICPACAQRVAEDLARGAR